MILYNITAIVEVSASTEWLSWMKQHYVPKVIDTHLFSAHSWLQVIDSPNEGITYCLQFTAESRNLYNQFLEKFATNLDEELELNFKGRYVTYRTLMEYI